EVVVRIESGDRSSVLGSHLSGDVGFEVSRRLNAPLSAVEVEVQGFNGRLRESAGTCVGENQVAVASSIQKLRCIAAGDQRVKPLDRRYPITTEDMEPPWIGDA